MNRFNPRKLALSKWAARAPLNREKHFIVTQLLCDDEGTPLQVEMQAVLTGRSEVFDWQELRDSTRWLLGWK